MNQVIKSHNFQFMKNTAKNKNTQSTYTCNCRKSADCPFRGKCLVSDIILYKATVASNNVPISASYVGQCSGQSPKKGCNNNLKIVLPIRLTFQIGSVIPCRLVLQFSQFLSKTQPKSSSTTDKVSDKRTQLPKQNQSRR